MSVLLNNRYLVLQTLGSGGFGHTFLAEDTHMPSKRRCVIKQLKPLTGNPAVYQIIKERFKREAANLEILGKSNDQIPALYAYFTEANEFYLVQEWIEGKNLLTRVQYEGPFSETAVTNLLVNILPVLVHIHSQHIIHRDIKPENIILRDSDNKPVLIDFGAVKEAATTLDSHITPAQTIVIGTPGFMPLEQAAGQPVYASDLYSLGVTAIYLLTGKYPEELTDPQTGSISWSNHVPNVSLRMTEILRKAVQPLARDRPQTAQEMLDALCSAATSMPPTILIEDEHGGATPKALTPAVGSSRATRRRHTLSYWLAAGVGVVLAIILVWQQYGSRFTTKLSEPSIKPSQILDSPVQPVTTISHTLVDETLQKNASSFQEIVPGTKAGELTFTQVKLNSNPVINYGEMRVDAIRVRTPAESEKHLVWTFVTRPGDPPHGFFIVPRAGVMAQGFKYSTTVDPPLHYSVVPPSWRSGSLVLQALQATYLEPNKEYIIWFGFRHDRPTELLVAINFVTYKGLLIDNGKPNIPAIEKLLGLKWK